MAVGCGGDDEISAQEYRAEVSKLCRSYSQSVEAAADKVVDDPNADAPAPAAFDVLLRFNDKELPAVLDQIEALDGPVEQRELVGAYLVEARKRQASYGDDLVSALAENTKPFARLEQLADEAGIESCI